MSKLICTDCGSQKKPKTVTSGSFFIEIILWICFIIPGLIYTIWRQGAKRVVCVDCGSKKLIPLKSPKGQEIVSKPTAKDIMRSRAEGAAKSIQARFDLKLTGMQFEEMSYIIFQSMTETVVIKSD